MEASGKKGKGRRSAIEAKLESLQTASDEEIWLDLYAGYLRRMTNELETLSSKRNEKPLIEKVLDYAYGRRNVDAVMRGICERIALQDIDVFPYFTDYFLKKYGTCYYPRSASYLFILRSETERHLAKEAEFV
jgi:hypothetical protein